jgi:hypothetical protein
MSPQRHVRSAEARPSRFSLHLKERDHHRYFVRSHGRYGFVRDPDSGSISQLLDFIIVQAEVMANLMYHGKSNLFA